MRTAAGGDCAKMVYGEDPAMLATFLSSLAIVFPLILLIGVGYLFKRVGFLTEAAVQGLTKVIMYAVIPANIFVHLYQADFRTNFTPRFVGFCIAAALLDVFLALILFAPVKDNKKKAAVMQCAPMPNNGNFGLPLSEAISPTAVGCSALANSFTAPIFNTYAVVVLEHYAGRKATAGQLVRKVLSNPVIIATLLGLAVKLSGIALPAVVLKPLTLLSQATAALSMISIGARFSFDKPADVPLTIAGVGYRLVLIPAIVLPLAVWIGLRGDQLIGVVTCLCSPVAVAAFAMAANYDNDLALTTNIVVYSYLGTLVTMPVIIFILRILELI